MSHSRVTRAACAVMLSTLVSVWLAPAAHAQLGGGIGDAIGEVGEAIGGGGSDSGSGGGGLIGGITDGLEGGSSGSGSGGGTTEEGGGGLVGGVVDKVEETVSSGKDSVEEVTSDPENPLGNVGTGTIGSVVETVEETAEGVKGDLAGTSNKRERKTRTDGGKETSSPKARVDVFAHSYAGALEADHKNVAALAEGKTLSAEPAASISDESLVTQIGRIATEAAEQVAFPLALTLFVIGFLMIQNRIDRRDPKLALAPVDSEHDLLSFT